MTTRSAKVSKRKDRPSGTRRPEGDGQSEAQPEPAQRHSAAFMEPEQRRAMIAEAAYYRSVRRSFEPGHELEDWLLAESDVDSKLVHGEVPTPCGS